MRAGQRTMAAVVVGAVLAVALVGCGGSGSEGAKPTVAAKAGAAACAGGKQGPGVTITGVSRENSYGNQEVFNSPIVAAPGAVWFVNDTLATSSLQQVDPKTGAPGNLVEVEASDDMSRLALGDGSLWQAGIDLGGRRSGTKVNRIDARTGTIVGTIIVEFDRISAMQTLGADLWVFGSRIGGDGVSALAKIDPSTGAILEQYPTGSALSSAQQIAFDLGRVWLSGPDGDGHGTVVWIDQATTQIHTVDLGELQPSGVAVGDKAIWTSGWKERPDQVTSELAKLGSDGTVEKTLPVDLQYAESMVVDDGSLWVLGGERRVSVIERRDLATGEVLASTCTTVQSHNFAVADGVAWLSSGPDLARVELGAGH